MENQTLDNHVPNSQLVINPIDNFIEKQMTAVGIVGLAAAIIVNEKLVWTKGYGYSYK